MVPVITLSEETFAKLQAIGQTFVDTPETVIDRLASEELDRTAGLPNGRGSAGAGAEAILRLEVDAHDDLKHTRILSARIDGQPVPRPKWNGILAKLHVMALKSLGSFEDLQVATGSNVKEGRFDKNGYKYLPNAGLSIQGVESNLAWEHSLQLARALAIPIELKIEWRNKQGAARPGDVGILEWSPQED